MGLKWGSNGVQMGFKWGRNRVKMASNSEMTQEDAMLFGDNAAIFGDNSPMGTPNPRFFSRRR